ncbi:MAG: TPM domain-containing protein [Bacteroidota bacterium]|nr:TPM domain-containing protein [Bacteroidota bacterium]
MPKLHRKFSLIKMLRTNKGHRYNKVLLTAFLFACTFVVQFAFAQTEIPKVVDPVTDLTNTIDIDQYRSLRKQIIRFEDTTSNQLVVLMLSTLNGEEIRDFGMNVLKENKIGQQGKDNGVLILIAKDDRKISIEVGYGLEGVLTDALCEQIIQNEIRPKFREGDYYGGISAAIESIMLATKGEYKGERKRNSDSGWAPVFIIFIIIMIFSFLSGRARRSGISSRGYNSWWWGGFGGGGSGGSWGSFGGGGGGGGWSAGGGSFGGGGASGSW